MGCHLWDCGESCVSGVERQLRRVRGLSPALPQLQARAIPHRPLSIKGLVIPPPGTPAGRQHQLGPPASPTPAPIAVTEPTVGCGWLKVLPFLGRESKMEEVAESQACA